MPENDHFILNVTLRSLFRPISRSHSDSRDCRASERERGAKRMPFYVDTFHTHGSNFPTTYGIQFGAERREREREREMPMRVAV
jgi:hypothetical protein